MDVGYGREVHQMDMDGMDGIMLIGLCMRCI